MKVYGWIPKSYGELVYVMAESPEAAKEAIKKRIAERVGDDFDARYERETLEEFLTRPHDEEFSEGQLIRGEIA